MVSFCTECGAKVEQNFKFCPTCGSEINLSSSAQKNLDEVASIKSQVESALIVEKKTLLKEMCAVHAE